jgi:hypothetical protein
MPAKHPWRDAALCVTFANLCLVGSWMEWNGLFRMLNTNLREVDDPRRSRTRRMRPRVPHSEHCC